MEDEKEEGVGEGGKRGRVGWGWGSEAGNGIVCSS
jgi:hypothetical protein